MRGWLMLALGLGFAVLVGYSLLTARQERPAASDATIGRASPQDHIDQDSRDAMRDILRQADDAGPGQ